MTDELVTYLRGLPDDWGSWLVLADTLTEAGDDRGQLLVLEHQRSTAAARALADEWMEVWRWELGEDDYNEYEWLRELAPLAAAAPADLAPTFARPISQLLALLVPYEDPRPRVSPVFALQRDRVTAATLTWIERAFDGVPVPDEDHRTIFQAEAEDNRASCDRSRDHTGRWQDLPDEHLLENQWALPHLDEQGIRYYVPAVMRFALGKRNQEHWITESLEYTLQRTSAELRGHQERCFALFDRAQRAAIYAFTLAAGHRDASKAWQRVFEAERDGERSDWFAVFWKR